MNFLIFWIFFIFFNFSEFKIDYLIEIDFINRAGDMEKSGAFDQIAIVYLGKG